LKIDDVQALAWRLMGQPTPKLKTPNPDAALYRYWLSDKSVGTPMTGELALEDGTVAIVMSTGKILLWTGGDNVEVR
jgi:hypothetical protein